MDWRSEACLTDNIWFEIFEFRLIALPTEWKLFSLLLERHCMRFGSSSNGQTDQIRSWCIWMMIKWTRNSDKLDDTYEAISVGGEEKRINKYFAKNDYWIDIIKIFLNKTEAQVCSQCGAYSLNVYFDIDSNIFPSSTSSFSISRPQHASELN